MSFVRVILILFLGLLGSSCSYISMHIQGGKSIQGRVPAFSKAQASSFQVACDQAEVTLHRLNAQGQMEKEILLKGEVDSSGDFVLENDPSLNIDLQSPNVSYVLRASGCDSVFLRPLTGDTDQIIDQGATLLSLTADLVNTNRRKFQEIPKSEVADLIHKISEVRATDLNDLYEKIISSDNLTNSFQSLVNLAPTQLSESPPISLVVSVPPTLGEMATASISVVVNHWFPAYNPAFEWRVNGNLASQQRSWNYTTGKNSQGQKVLHIKVGADKGDGTIDPTKPYRILETTFKVLNTYPPIPPTMSLVGASILKNLSGQVQLNLGAGLSQCESFSSLALTNSVLMPPMLLSDFSITCSQVGMPLLSYLLAPGDGVKNLALWARDAEGNISQVPSVVSMTLDQTAPQLSFSTVTSVKGGDLKNLVFSASDALSGIDTLKLYYAQDGVDFNEVSDLSAGAGSYNWSVPLHDTLLARLKIVAVDIAGNSSEVVSPAFKIDSQMPEVTVASPLENALVQSSLVLSGNCESGLPIQVTSAGLAGDVQIACSSGTYSQTLNLIGADGVKTLQVRQTDEVGNVSTETISVIKDTTGPLISLVNAPTVAQAGGESFSLQFDVTEPHISTSQNLIIEISSNAGSSWSLLASVPSVIGPLSSHRFQVDVVWPEVNEAAVQIRVRGLDSLGNSGVSSLSAGFVVDHTAPQISSFILADGKENVAMVNVNYTLIATDNLSGLHSVRLSESSVYANTLWQPYTANGSFNLTGISGDKTVYVWVKDVAGNVSSPSSYQVKLDYGSPPELEILSPTSSAVGPVVAIHWTCTSTNGLDAQPIRIRYTTDDGVSFSPITEGWVANSGHFDWTLPGGVSIFRLIVECKSEAGVVSSNYSNFINTSGWSIFAGDPTDSVENINANQALMSASGGTRQFQSMAADQQGHLYFERDKAIMKIDALSGLVSRFAGVTGQAGCTIAAGHDPLVTGRNYIGNPFIYGTSADGQKLLFHSCGKIYSLHTQTRTLTEIHGSPPAPGGFLYFSEQRKAYFKDAQTRISSLDLNVSNASAQHIYGNGTCTSSTYGAEQIGTAATSLSSLGGFGSGGASTPNQCTEFYLFTNSTDSSIWVYSWSGHGGLPQAARLAWSTANSRYELVENDVGWHGQDWDKGYCVKGRFELQYCSSRHGTSNFSMFNAATNTWRSVPLTGGSRFVRYAKTNYGVASIDSLNQLLAYRDQEDGTYTADQIGGQNIETYGNGTQLSAVAFSDIRDMSYASLTNSLYIRTFTSSFLRKITFGAEPEHHISTVGNSNNISDTFTVLPDASAIVSARSWCGTWYFRSNWNAGLDRYNGNVHFYNQLGCNAGTSIAMPVPDNTPANGNLPWSSWLDPYATPLMHSNGKFYFFVKDRPGDLHAFIYSSDYTTLRIVAGKANAAGYTAEDHNGAAIGAQLKDVKWIGERPNQDILILDNDRFRLITLKTDEATTPKIIDTASLSLAAGYTVGTTSTLLESIYDSSVEIEEGGVKVPGSGALYYVTSARQVRKWQATAVSGGVVTAATDTAYSFAGTTLTGSVSLALTPAGLLVAQPSKKRILRVDP